MFLESKQQFSVVNIIKESFNIKVNYPVIFPAIVMFASVVKSPVIVLLPVCAISATIEIIAASELGAGLAD